MKFCGIRRKPRRTFFKIFLAAVLLFGPWTVPGRVSAQGSGQQFEGFDLQGYEQDGSKKWDLHGETADIQGERINITNVDANHYGQQPMNLKARTGTIDKASGNIHLERDVVITSKEGGRLKTEALDWYKEKDLVKSDQRVEISDPRLTAVGTGLEASPGLMTAQMDKDITMKIEPSASGAAGQAPVNIRCDGPMEIDQKQNRASLKGNVVAEQAGRTLKADEMEVFFDPDSQRVVKMICTGHFEMVQGGNSTQADKAVYDAVTQKIVLSGNPKMRLIPSGEGSIADLNKKKE